MTSPQPDDDVCMYRTSRIPLKCYRVAWRIAYCMMCWCIHWNGHRMVRINRSRPVSSSTGFEIDSDLSCGFDRACRHTGGAGVQFIILSGAGIGVCSTAESTRRAATQRVGGALTRLTIRSTTEMVQSVRYTSHTDRHHKPQTP